MLPVKSQFFGLYEIHLPEYDHSADDQDVPQLPPMASGLEVKGEFTEEYNLIEFWTKTKSCTMINFWR
ncbi:MAG TPA: hypothetical protein VFG01_08935 [Acidobacteriota bacterium]|nr:hypothetical protein [Acidobacteriota bacterium]